VPITDATWAHESGWNRGRECLKNPKLDSGGLDCGAFDEALGCVPPFARSKFSNRPSGDQQTRRGSGLYFAQRAKPPECRVRQSLIGLCRA